MRDVLIDPGLAKNQGTSFHEDLVGFIQASGLKIAIESKPKESKLWAAISGTAELRKIYQFLENQPSRLVKTNCDGIGDYSELHRCYLHLNQVLSQPLRRQ